MRKLLLPSALAIFGLLSTMVAGPAGAWINSGIVSWSECPMTTSVDCLESISVSMDQGATWIQLTRQAPHADIYSFTNSGYVPVAGESAVAVTLHKMTSMGELPGQDSTDQLTFDVMPYANGSATRAAMNEQATFKFVVRSGDYKPTRYSGMAKNLVTTFGNSEGINRITLIASPLKLAYVENQTQAVCEAPISKASGSTTYLSVVALKILNSDTQTQPVNVVANGSCGSGFSLNQSVGMLYPEIHYMTVGPHFLADGVTLNSGYFEASLSPEFLSQKLFLTQEQALNGGLSVAAGYTATPDTAIVNTVTPTADGGVRLVAEGFHFSAPTIKIKRAIGKLGIKTKRTGKQLAAEAGVEVPKKAKVTLTVTKASKSAKVCKVTSGKLVTLKKAGTCVVTLKVQPAKVKGKKQAARISTHTIRVG